MTLIWGCYMGSLGSLNTLHNCFHAVSCWACCCSNSWINMAPASCAAVLFEKCFSRKVQIGCLSQSRNYRLIKLTCKWGSWRFQKWWAPAQNPLQQFPEPGDLEKGKKRRVKFSFVQHEVTFKRCQENHSCDFLQHRWKTGGQGSKHWHQLLLVRPRLEPHFITCYKRWK